MIGRYRVLGLIGEGGMGRVLLVEHVITGKRHAIKMLHDEFSRNDGIVQRFLNEARAASEIGHRNVIEIPHADQIEGGGPWYLVMKYLEGQTLAKFLASSNGPIHQRQIVHIVGETLNGLQAAHDRKIIHRDLKPDNLFLTVHRDDNDPMRTVILDFGVAQLGHDAGVVTKTGAMIGTPHYMAPEQHRGAPIDHRADIWAIGAIVYEMATGRLPYADDVDVAQRQHLTGPEIFHRMMTRPIVDPRRFNPAITEEFATVVMSALHNEPIHRPGSARAFAVKLAEATPGDVDAPSGIEILKTYARELLQVENLLETMRSPAPAMAAGTNDERYELGARLGMGGMAEVFRATVRGAEGFHRTVALKRVLAGFSEMPQFSMMFIEEARIAMRLVHENAVTVADFYRDRAGRFCLVMELVAGKDLAALIETGPIPPPVAVFIAIKMLRGLGYAHELWMPSTQTRGVIHRDVSPHNVLISWQGAVKVSDFGIAKARDAEGSVRSLLLKGKPAYMSPEQANGEPLDPRSDLFSVGIVLWEMLTGRRLFDGGTQATFAQIFFRDPAPVKAHGIHISRELERILGKLLARDKKDRWASAIATIEALTSCAENPRDGENDLVRFLVERFPRDAVTIPPIVGGTTTYRPRVVAPPVPSTAAASTLGATASQVVATRAPLRKRRGRLSLTLALVAAGVTAVALIVRRDPHLVASGAGSDTQDVRDRSPSSADGANAVEAVVPSPMASPDARAHGEPPPDASAADAHRLAAPDPASPPPPPPPPDAGVRGAPPPPQDAGVRDARAIAASPAATGRGRLNVIVLPWAEVWVDGKPLGQAPVMNLSLPAGPHRVRIRNDAHDKTVPVIVTTSKITVIDETW